MNMHFPTAVTATVLAALIVTMDGVAARAAEPQRVAYRIDVQVVHSPNDRQTEVLSSPSVITYDRQEASLQIAKAEQVTIEGDEVVTIESGVTCRFTPYRLKDGSVKLDIETDVNLPPDGMLDVGVDIVTKKLGVRRIQKVPLGKLIQIPITPRGQFPGYHLSLMISEAPRPELNDEAAKPVPAVKFTSDNLQKFLDEWEDFWFLETPDHLLPFRTHGGIID